MLALTKEILGSGKDVLQVNPFIERHFEGILSNKSGTIDQYRIDRLS
jgi:putative IMPACT (imprinted ancient) family translation regulator